jgi:hypothetical protein
MDCQQLRVGMDIFFLFFMGQNPWVLNHSGARGRPNAETQERRRRGRGRSRRDAFRRAPGLPLQGLIEGPRRPRHLRHHPRRCAPPQAPLPDPLRGGCLRLAPPLVVVAGSFSFASVDLSRPGSFAMRAARRRRLGPCLVQLAAAMHGRRKHSTKQQFGLLRLVTRPPGKSRVLLPNPRESFSFLL